MNDSFIVVVVIMISFAVFRISTAKKEQVSYCFYVEQSFDGKSIHLSIYLFDNSVKQVHMILHAEINIHRSR